MSLSLARPIEMAPVDFAGPEGPANRGERIFTIRVARLDTSAVLALSTFDSAGAGLTLTVVTSSRTGCGVGLRSGRLGTRGGGGGGGGGGGAGRGRGRPFPRLAGPGGAWRGGGGGVTDQARVGGPLSCADLLLAKAADGGLGWARWAPNSKVNRGPVGLPTLMLWPS